VLHFVGVSAMVDIVIAEARRIMRRRGVDGPMDLKPLHPGELTTSSPKPDAPLSVCPWEDMIDHLRQMCARDGPIIGAR
jgi:hypothetical protein